MNYIWINHCQVFYFVRLNILYYISRAYLLKLLEIFISKCNLFDAEMEDYKVRVHYVRNCFNSTSFYVIWKGMQCRYIHLLKIISTCYILSYTDYTVKDFSLFSFLKIYLNFENWLHIIFKWVEELANICCLCVFFSLFLLKMLF